jgi:hypothetical protein
MHISVFLYALAQINLSDRVMDPIPEFLGLLRVHAREQNHELVPAQTDKYVVLTDNTGNRLDQFPQNLIPGLVPELVVYVLEAVQIYKHQGHGEALALGKIQDARGMAEKIFPVVGPGKRIYNPFPIQLGVIQHGDETTGQNRTEMLQKISVLVREIAVGIGIYKSNEPDCPSLMEFVQELAYKARPLG